MAWRPSPTPKFSETSQDLTAPYAGDRDPRKRQLTSGLLIAWSIAGINFYIYYRWKRAEFDAHHGDATLLRYMRDNYTVSRQNWEDGRYWTVITAGFSHEAFWHYLANTIGIVSFFTGVTVKMGVVPALASYLAAIAGGSFAHLYVTRQKPGDARNESALKSIQSLFGNRPLDRKAEVPGLLGASAGVFGLFTLTTIFAPTLMVQLLFIPIPAWAAWGLMVGVDSYCALSPEGRQKMTQVTGIQLGHEAHLGGVATGILASFLFTPRFWLRR